MDMKKSFSFSSITIVLLVIVVLVMSVGYANFSRNLTINGSATVGASSWNIKFLDSTYTETTGSETLVPGTDSLKISETSMSYTVTLSEPGDFYEFTIKAKNAGTFDAVLDGITMSALTDDEKKYLTYEVSYAGTSYTESQTDLGIAMDSGAEVPVKVTVRYFQPTSEADLPDEEKTITLNASLSFKQKVE